MIGAIELLTLEELGKFLTKQKKEEERRKKKSKRE
jgi:hypothetical protein